MDYRLKGLSIESNNSHNGILTKELCKLQAMKKISNLQHLMHQHQQPLFLVIFRCSINSIWYQDIYGWIRDSKGFLRVSEHLKWTPNEEVIAVQSWRTQPENPVRRTSRGLLFSLIFGHNLCSSCIKIYMDGFYTQSAFHRDK